MVHSSNQSSRKILTKEDLKGWNTSCHCAVQVPQGCSNLLPEPELEPETEPKPAPETEPGANHVG